MNYRAAMEYMESLNSYGIVPGLSNMTELCRRIGNPQEELKLVHIAGTNGKGSVLAYISTVLKAAGYQVGRYISPVIFEYRERIQINESMISQKDVCAYIEEIKNACDDMVKDGCPHPTPFEFETAMAFLYFQRKGCDIVVLETGMGGRLDATNIITAPLISVIASISMDHMKFLGGTLAEIAREKAGIIKESRPVICMAQEPEAMEILAKAAEAGHCTLTVADASKAGKVKFGLEKQRFDYAGYKGLEISLAGKCQIDNAALAVEAIKELGRLDFTVSEAALRKGLLETRWTGRFTVLGKKPLFIADGAHNEDAARKLADSIRFYFTNKRIVYIMGILRDKEYEKIIAETYAYAEEIITVTPPGNPRALPAMELAQAVREYHPRVTMAGSLEEAVEMAYLLADRDAVIISFGSLSYLGQLIHIVENKYKPGSKSNGKQRKN